MIIKLKKKNICIIPARGGSKRIPLKNIKSFFGKPIIYYPIKTALKSDLFDKVIVSTDNLKIAKVSKKFGAEVHIRSSKYADDYTDTISVVKNVIGSIDIKKKYLKICCIYPTSIFLTNRKLKEAFIKLKKNNNYIFSACNFEKPVERSFCKKKKKIKMLIEKNFYKRSQDLKTYYYDAAQFYLGWRSSWTNKKKIFSGPNDFINFKSEEVQDIDSKNDWELAKKKWKGLNLKKKY